MAHRESRVVDGVLICKTGTALAQATARVIVNYPNLRLATIGGLSSVNDGLGGTFVLVSSSDSADNNTIVPTRTVASGLRWKRLDASVGPDPLCLTERSSGYTPSTVSNKTCMWAAASGQLFYRRDDGGIVGL